MPKSNNSVLSVLFVVHYFDKMGGAVTRTTNLTKNLYKHKIDASILTTYLSKDAHTTLIRANLSKIFIRKNQSHERIPTGFDIFTILSMIIDLLKYLKRHKCDLIYVRPTPEDMLACLFVSIFKRKPLIIELHNHPGSFEGQAFFRLYLRMVEKLMITSARKVVVNSMAFCRELMSVHGENLGKKVCVVPNSVDLNMFHLHDNQSLISIDSSKQIIGFIGSLKPDEDLLCLARAAKIVLQKYQKAVFIVIGQDMGLKRELESEIEKLGLKDRFSLIDEKPYREIPGILETFSVFVAPRLNNERTRYAMPIKILEAMALGVPVIATSLPPIQELTNDAAILIPPSDHVSLADGIVRLLKDHNLRNEIIIRGLERAENFDLEKIARYFAKILVYTAR
jgi:glycosyltransferase involved in cell wall biosynthesis